MEHIILVIHAIIAIVVVALILLQQGKGAEAGASFGSGGSQTVFGVQGGGNLLTRWTGILVALFFVTSLGLAYIAKQKSVATYEVIPGIPVVEQLDSEIPQVNAVESSNAADELPTE